MSCQCDANGPERRVKSGQRDANSQDNEVKSGRRAQ